MKDKLTSLIAGPTDKTKLFRFGNITQREYNIFLEERGKVLAKNLSQINLIPDDGVPFDIAKSYKKAGGALVVGYIPRGEYPISKDYFNFCDKIEEFDSGWPGLNTCLSLKGDLITVFGLSPGTLVEIAYTKYHKKYLGIEIPILIDKNTINGIFPPELLDELTLHYFSSNEELNKILQEFKRV
ncbi:MAG: hypothetical protein KJ623_03040 [Nanoarchaeota archaeon]|nr:hypothetical protein [Nanoarchaeota archaeon]MBU0962384.1 hypothetical protein [Nanoarchaeota archaeon]